MPRSYIEAIKASVAGRAKNAGPAWEGDFEEEMVRKTVVQHAKKYIPKGLVTMQGDRILPADIVDAEDADFEGMEEQALGQSAQIEHQTADASLQELQDGLRQQSMSQGDQIAERVAARAQEQEPAPAEAKQEAPAEAAPQPAAEGKKKGKKSEAEADITPVATIMQDIKALPGAEDMFVSEMARRIADSTLTDEQKRLAVHALTKAGGEAARGGW